MANNRDKLYNISLVSKLLLLSCQIAIKVPQLNSRSISSRVLQIRIPKIRICIWQGSKQYRRGTKLLVYAEKNQDNAIFEILNANMVHI